MAVLLYVQQINDNNNIKVSIYIVHVQSLDEPPVTKINSGHIIDTKTNQHSIISF